ncbi:class I SAM-dependent methyltransferase [Ramlibacter sp. PS4R-6]|uniref:class I SAM-dependent methyltransferase n=1 Tax=Ramlibacter sp. PS4R-6 TaxID=3133438 RepID=UPI0030AF114C
MESSHPTARAEARDLDSINRRTWAQRETVRLYEKLQGWTDSGERVALDFVADAARGEAILDMGVGAGRTTQFLQPLSQNYTAIDYTGEMVQAFRKLHPGIRCEQMDARDLSAFHDEQFGLVVFSFNGIDAVDIPGRMKVLREVYRVLRPGGRFFFSAHNHEGPGRGEQPQLHIPFTWNPLKLGWRSFKSIRALPRSLMNHRKLRTMNESHEGWSIMNAGAHDFGIVVMYTTFTETKRQLREVGFEVEAVFDSSRGQKVEDGADTRDAFWFHYIARKP